MEDNKKVFDVAEFIKPEKKKREKKVKKAGMNWKTKAKLVLVGTLVFVTGVAYTAERYVNWRAEHEWQSPIVLRGMVRAIERTVNSPVAHAESKVQLTDMEIIDQYRLAPAIHSIYMLESTEGKNDGCKEEGKFNGYGFRQNSKEHKCFDSFEEVTEWVNSWFEEVLSENGNDLMDAVCYYNTGIHQPTCGDYSANFSSVITNYFK